MEGGRERGKKGWMDNGKEGGVTVHKDFNRLTTYRLMPSTSSVAQGWCILKHFPANLTVETNVHKCSL